MAKNEHVEVLKKGVEAWNIWRKNNPSIKPDLRLIDFHGLKLPWVKKFPQKQEKGKLSLQEAFSFQKKFPWHRPRINLSGINFSDTDLTEVNLENAYMEGANLANARLKFSRLRDSILEGEVSLIGANLTGADLRMAFLNGATIEDADLTAADFSYGILRHASLQNSVLTRTIFVGADLRNANFNNASFDATVLGGAVLKGAIDLESSSHYGPSIVDPQTVNSSGGLPKRFLRGCGWPEALIDFTSTIPEQGSYFSCFISYNHKDKEFACRLHEELQNRGIRCWLDKDQIVSGDDIYERVQDGIRKWDKVLLCCSEASLNSWWVDLEIATTFEKERELTRERGKKVKKLIPLDIDGFLSSGKWDSGKAVEVRTRAVCDFFGWKQDDAIFERQLGKVVKALCADDSGKESSPKSKL